MNGTSVDVSVCWRRGFPFSYGNSGPFIVIVGPSLVPSYDNRESQSNTIAINYFNMDIFLSLHMGSEPVKGFL